MASRLKISKFFEFPAATRRSRFLTSWLARRCGHPPRDRYSFFSVPVFFERGITDATNAPLGCIRDAWRCGQLLKPLGNKGNRMHPVHPKIAKHGTLVRCA